MTSEVIGFIKPSRKFITNISSENIKGNHKDCGLTKSLSSPFPSGKKGARYNISSDLNQDQIKKLFKNIINPSLLPNARSEQGEQGSNYINLIGWIIQENGQYDKNIIKNCDHETINLIVRGLKAASDKFPQEKERILIILHGLIDICSEEQIVGDEKNNKKAERGTAGIMIDMLYEMPRNPTLGLSLAELSRKITNSKYDILEKKWNDEDRKKMGEVLFRKARFFSKFNKIIRDGDHLKNIYKNDDKNLLPQIRSNAFSVAEKLEHGKHEKINNKNPKKFGKHNVSDLGTEMLFDNLNQLHKSDLKINKQDIVLEPLPKRRQTITNYSQKYLKGAKSTEKNQSNYYETNDNKERLKKFRNIVRNYWEDGNSGAVEYSFSNRFKIEDIGVKKDSSGLVTKITKNQKDQKQYYIPGHRFETEIGDKKVNMTITGALSHKIDDEMILYSLLDDMLCAKKQEMFYIDMKPEDATNMVKLFENYNGKILQMPNGEQYELVLEPQIEEGCVNKNSIIQKRKFKFINSKTGEEKKINFLNFTNYYEDNSNFVYGPERFMKMMEFMGDAFVEPDKILWRANCQAGTNRSQLILTISDYAMRIHDELGRKINKNSSKEDIINAFYDHKNFIFDDTILSMSIIALNSSTPKFAQTENAVNGCLVALGYSLVDVMRQKGVDNVVVGEVIKEISKKLQRKTDYDWDREIADKRKKNSKYHLEKNAEHFSDNDSITSELLKYNDDHNRRRKFKSNNGQFNIVNKPREAVSQIIAEQERFLRDARNFHKIISLIEEKDKFLPKDKLAKIKKIGANLVTKLGELDKKFKSAQNSDFGVVIDVLNEFFADQELQDNLKSFVSFYHQNLIPDPKKPQRYESHFHHLCDKNKQSYNYNLEEIFSLPIEKMAKISNYINKIVDVKTQNSQSDNSIKSELVEKTKSLSNNIQKTIKELKNPDLNAKNIGEKPRPKLEPIKIEKFDESKPKMKERVGWNIVKAADLLAERIWDKKISLKNNMGFERDFQIGRDDLNDLRKNFCKLLLIYGDILSEISDYKDINDWQNKVKEGLRGALKNRALGKIAGDVGIADLNDNNKLVENLMNCCKFCVLAFQDENPDLDYIDNKFDIKNSDGKYDDDKLNYLSKSFYQNSKEKGENNRDRQK